jgi:hypothetical protein
MAASGGADRGFVRRKPVTAYNDATMRTITDFGEFGHVTLDEPVPHGGTGRGPRGAPLQAVPGALCGWEAVTFHRTAAELGLRYESLDFEAAFTIDVQGRQGDRSVRPHFQAVRVRAVEMTGEPLAALATVIEETEARCRVRNLLLDARWTCGSSGFVAVAARWRGSSGTDPPSAPHASAWSAETAADRRPLSRPCLARRRGSTWPTRPSSGRRSRRTGWSCSVGDVTGACARLRLRLSPC